jgi:N-acylneuraminate cytidylyltransferase
MPNCPFRNAQDVKASYEQFLNSNTDAQLSISRYGWLNPWWAFKINLSEAQANKLEPLFPEALKTRSQDLPELFCPTGAIWWAKTSALRHHQSFYTGTHTGFELSWQHALDIDDDADWLMAEAVLKLMEEEKRKNSLK